MTEKKIVVGLSGGVDSSVAAFLLKEQGYEVTGCFMRSFDTDTSKRELELAEKLAEKLSIGFLVVDRREDFKKEVIRYFISSYMEGRTPNPCCICNRTVKWPALIEAMKKAGASFIATGHYAAIGQDGAGGRFYVQRAKQLRKDQSYALYNLTQEELKHTLMPLSGYFKEDVRELARRIGLDTADKPDSQEICFIEAGDYSVFIKEHLELMLPEDMKDLDKAADEWMMRLGARLEERGSFVDTEGNVLGEHAGIINYTVGQRKGLNIALGRRAFVKELRPGKNQVVLSSDEELFSDHALVVDINLQLLDPEAPEAYTEDGFEAMVKIRYADKGRPARIRMKKDNGRLKAELAFYEPARAVTPGQAAVFYDEEGRILGGGTILL